MICAAAITMERIVPPAVFYLKSQVPRLCTVEKIWFMTRCGSGAKKGGGAQEKISPRLRKNIPVFKKGRPFGKKYRLIQRLLP